MKLKNPFLTAGYAGEEYFCDRVEETGKLLGAIENNRNVTLIAPRRYGKTGLVSNAFARLPEGVAGVYLDVYATRDLAGFTKALASAVFGALDTPVEKAVSVIGRFLKSCRPTARSRSRSTSRRATRKRR